MLHLVFISSFERHIFRIKFLTLREHCSQYATSLVPQRTRWIHGQSFYLISGITYIRNFVSDLSPPRIRWPTSPSGSLSIPVEGISGVVLQSDSLEIVVSKSCRIIHSHLLINDWSILNYLADAFHVSQVYKTTYLITALNSLMMDHISPVLSKSAIQKCLY